MVTIVDMRDRLAATTARLRSAGAAGGERNRRLAALLEAVERKFAALQRENRDLRAAGAAARDEARQLRALLHDALALAESDRAGRPALPPDAFEALIERLNEIAAAAAPPPGERPPGPDR